MTGRVSSKRIDFILPVTLTDAIKKIEDNLSGWWWSISQTPNRISLSAGPGRNCPNNFDNLFGLTDTGDKGSVNSIYFRHLEGYNLEDSMEPHLGLLINQVVAWAEINRTGIETGLIDHKVKEPPHSGIKCRRQSKEDLERLILTYTKFLEKISLIERQGYILRELYLGSCDVSADCSIRGKRPDNTEFDVTIDLTDKDSSISDSLAHSVIELINDILTPGQKLSNVEESLFDMFFPESLSAKVLSEG